MTGTEPTLEVAAARVRRARLGLMLGEPYLAAAVARYPIVAADPGSEIATFATDGYRIMYSPEFAVTRSQGDLKFILAHEILHCLLGHMDRRGERGALRWNVAVDLAVNGALSDFGFDLPADALFEYWTRGLAAEGIYEHLVTDRDALACLEDLPRMDEHRDPADGVWCARASSLVPLPSPQERRRVRRQLLAEVLRDPRVPGTARGRLSAEVRRASEPAVDWRSHLAEFVGGLRRDDYRMFPFHRKHLWRGLYLPSAGVPAPRHLVVAVDTSGSISEPQLSRFLSELDALRGVTQCRLSLLEFDAGIQREVELEAYERSTVSDEGSHVFHGRGGTDIRLPFEWVRTRSLGGETEPDAMIVATDGFGPMPSAAPGYGVLWLVPSVSAGRFPFGRVIRLDP